MTIPVAELLFAGTMTGAMTTNTTNMMTTRAFSTIIMANTGVTNGTIAATWKRSCIGATTTGWSKTFAFAANPRLTPF